MGGASIVRGTLASVALLALAFVALVDADPSPFPAPVVIVYPLTGTGGTPADVGGNVAILLSTKLAQLGGITVKPFTPGTQRPQYLQAALDADADYYITGYLTPVGDDVSLITQIVSTHSGSIAFSSTAIVRTYGDIVGQADTLREAILRHAGRGFPAVEQPAPVPTGTPETSNGKGGGVNLSKALGRHNRNQSTPSPAASASAAALALGSTPAPATTAAPTATAAPSTAAPAVTASATGKPAPATPSPAPFGTPASRVALAPPHGGALVVQFDAGAPPGDSPLPDAGNLTHAQFSLAAAIQRAGMSGGGAVPIASTDAIKSTKSLCDATPGSKTVVTGVVSLVTGADGSPMVQIDAVAYDCSGAVVGKQSASTKIVKRGGVDGAIDRVTAAEASNLVKLFSTAPG
jgi:hypothetical protein